MFIKSIPFPQMNPQAGHLSPVEFRVYLFASPARLSCNQASAGLTGYLPTETQANPGLDQRMLSRNEWKASFFTSVYLRDPGLGSFFCP